MTHLTNVQVAAYAHSAGFSGDTLVTATAIALAESNGNTTATHKNTNGSTDYGLFQVNSVHKPSEAQQKNPLENAKLAVFIYKAAGNKFTPWATYNSGSYKSKMASARAGVKRLQQLGPEYENEQVKKVVENSRTDIEQLKNDTHTTGLDVGSAINALSNGIQSIGVVLVAIAVFVIGAVLINKNAVKNAVKLVK